MCKSKFNFRDLLYFRLIGTLMLYDPLVLKHPARLRRDAEIHRYEELRRFLHLRPRSSGPPLYRGGRGGQQGELHLDPPQHGQVLLLHWILSHGE